MKRYTVAVCMMVLAAPAAMGALSRPDDAQKVRQGFDTLVANGTGDARLLRGTMNPGSIHPRAKLFLAERQQFRLDHLTTEQRHPASWGISSLATNDTAAALSALWRVDGDIVTLTRKLQADPAPLIDASRQVEHAWREGHRVLLYGCGSTGRLAKTLQQLWQQFFARSDRLPCPSQDLPLFRHLRTAVRGEITGGDRALISSLEGFEDLPIVGALQLQSLGYRPGDVLFAVSEGGETSSVLGMLEQARRLRPTDDGRLFFVFNNPSKQLKRLERSRSILEDPHIKQLNLTTGPQAIAGSTRMQATTSELLALGSILEDALVRVAAPLFNDAERTALGLDPNASIGQRIARFSDTLSTVKQKAHALARFTDAEAAAYAHQQRATYRADNALATVFTDATERGPTFRLAPLDPVFAEAGKTKRKVVAERQSWLHVASSAPHAPAAWAQLLGRPFQGLDVQHFASAIKEHTADAELVATAERSLQRAGPSEGARYDFSAASLRRAPWRPQKEDFYLTIALGDEDLMSKDLARKEMGSAHHLRIFDKADVQKPAKADLDGQVLDVHIPRDPLLLQQNLAAKLLLNAQSTAVMCKMGRVVGNTMAFVQPSNLKLIGRATFLIQLHTNEVLERLKKTPITYEQANSLLFEAIDARERNGRNACPSEVSMAVGMALSQVDEGGERPSWEKVIAAIEKSGLERFKQEKEQGELRL